MTEEFNRSMNDFHRAIARLDATTLLAVVVLGAGFGVIVIKLITIALDVYR